jgi:hypothetical protein
VTAMGGAERDTPTKMKTPTLQESANDTTSRATLSPTRHEADALNIAKVSGPLSRHPPTPLRRADHQHHLPGPPSRRPPAHAGAATPHDAATRNPCCTGQTARRPRPMHQHPGPPPRHKVEPSPLRRVDGADNLAALATQDRRPSHMDNNSAP